MEHQSGFAHPCRHFGQRFSGFGFAATEDDEVVRVTNHLPALARHLMVERVEVNVRQQRTDDCSLRSALRGRLPAPTRFQHALLQILFQQPQEASVGDFLFHQLQQLVLWDAVEVAFQVGVHHPRLTLREQGFQCA